MARIFVPVTVEGIVPEERRAETLEFLGAYELDLKNAGHEIVRHPCSGFQDYESGWVAEHARGVPYAVLEQDVLPESLEFVASFLECPEALCVAPVEQHQPLGGVHAGQLDANGSAHPPCEFGSCVPWSGLVRADGSLVMEPGTEHVAWSVSAMLKVGGRLLNKPLDFGGGFSTLDSRFYNFCTRDGLMPSKGAHVHWPSTRTFLAHRHPVCRDPEWPA